MKVSSYTTHASIHNQMIKTDDQLGLKVKKDTNNENYLISKREVKNTVEKMNQFNDPTITDLKFVFHEDLNEYYVTVVDPITSEVIREIPPKKMLDMYVSMVKFIGLLVDEKV